LDILSAVLEVSVDELRTEPVISAHGWDSLSSLDALCQLEQRFDIRLDLRSFHATRTVEDLTELVASTSAKSRAT
jgi:acyl carrier protein